MKKSVIILPFSLMDGFTYKENVDIPFTSISTAYLGKANRCMCGCSGNYKTPASTQSGLVRTGVTRYILRKFLIGLSVAA